MVEGECFMTIVSHGAGFPFAIEENLTLILILCITWIYQKLFLNNGQPSKGVLMIGKESGLFVKF